MAAFQPITVIYTHLHDAIRRELGELGAQVAELGTAAGGDGLTSELQGLRQVVYPALDSKVRNVTLAYSVEHEDEEHLFEQLAQLLGRALAEDGGGGQAATLRLLACKVEQVHTTLRRHLAKEEEHLLPLLLQNFAPGEQAELVAQFLCCIPLATVARVLTWLRRTVPAGEQAALLGHLRAVVSDRLLRQLLVSWLAPVAQAGHCAAAGGGKGDAASGIDAEFVCCRGRGPCSHAAAGGPPAAPSGKPPLQEIGYFHQAIRSALQSFAAETRTLQTAGAGVTPGQLASLAERHRFIRAVCSFHSASEDEVVFPAMKQLRAAQRAARQEQQDAEEVQQRSPAANGVQLGQKVANGTAQANGEAEGSGAAAESAQDGLDRLSCEDDHNEEITRLEELGRMLSDVRARNAKEVAALVSELAVVAEGLSKAMSRQMAREEVEVLPVLMRGLCVAEQRRMVWQVLRAMPLRLLERVMPWVAGKLADDDVREWLANIRLAAPAEDAPLVELLGQWARRGKHVPPAVAAGGSGGGGGGAAGPAPSSIDDPALYPNHTCGPASFLSALAEADAALAEGMDIAGPGSVGDAAPAALLGSGEQPNLKRIRTTEDGTAALLERRSSHSAASSSSPGTDASGIGDSTPIDHIFQFHKALRRELRDLEAAAVELYSASDGVGRGSCDQLLPSMEARFQFLRGIYRAHSHAEDNIVFPALEGKERLINISHSYSLDHKQEEELFDDVLGDVKAAPDPGSRRTHMVHLSRMCAAIRASLETHLRAEEKELWPLFAEHFSVAEQERLVGQIIGSTGAEVLHSMLSWVQGSMTQEEQEAMMLAFKSASRSTAFEQWLDVALGPAQPGSPRARLRAEAASCPPAVQDEMQGTLTEVAQYLAAQGLAGAGAPAPADPGGVAAQSAQFRPGWEDIFRMNQKQLEAAIRCVSSDATLEPQRKAYLIQNIMASRYIVAQQRRLAARADSGLGSTPTAAAAAATAQQQQQPGAAAAAAPSGRPAQQQEAADTQQARQAGGVTRQAGHADPLSAGKSYHDGAAGILGCRHYRRRCRLVAPCCGAAHVCRLCHDDASDHQLDRYAVAEMVCMECSTRQAVAASCSSCGARMAAYYCSICHLFDDQPGRDIYHCPFCNFCRQGKGLGVDSFHCMSCNACMSLELFNRHACKEQSLQGTCPVCSDRLFESKHPIKARTWGPGARVPLLSGYACPVCSKSLGDMAVYWRMIDSLLAAETLPPEYAGRTQTVLCNDCTRVGTAPFHFVYHKCGDVACGSYNTRVVSEGAAS
eukprot:scaffold15.g4372.t1